jgi:hypothetical protein
MPVFCLGSFVGGMWILIHIIGDRVDRPFILINNAGVPVTIQSDGAFFHLPAGEAGEVVYPYQTGVFIISAAGTAREYRWVAPGNSFAPMNNVFLQVEADWQIYVLPQASYGPLKQLPAKQPAGYPLAPSRPGR